MTTYECKCGWTVAGNPDPDEIWDDLDTMIEQHEQTCGHEDMGAVEKAIRDNMPPYRAEHVLDLIQTENDPGASAKNTTGAADSATLIGERTVNESTGNDTSENIIPNLADFIEIVDLGTEALSPVIDPKTGEQVRVRWRTRFDYDTYRVEVIRDDAQEVTQDFLIPSVPELTAEEAWRIRTRWACDILNGKVNNDRTHLFVDDLHTELDEAETRLKHPATCARGGDCLIRNIGSEIIHTSAARELASPSFNAEAGFEVITDSLDFTTDDTRLETMLVNITGTTEALIQGTLTDVRALGKFLIEQADRFEKLRAGGLERGD